MKEIADVHLLPEDRKLVLGCIGEYDAYMCDAGVVCDRELLDRASRLRVVVAPSTGTDHLDVKLLRERGIELFSLTTEYELLETFTATAELAWGLLLACRRYIPAGLAAVRHGVWARTQLAGGSECRPVGAHSVRPYACSSKARLAIAQNKLAISETA